MSNNGSRSKAGSRGKPGSGRKAGSRSQTGSRSKAGRRGSSSNTSKAGATCPALQILPLPAQVTFKCRLKFLYLHFTHGAAQQLQLQQCSYQACRCHHQASTRSPRQVLCQDHRHQPSPRRHHQWQWHQRQPLPTSKDLTLSYLQQSKDLRLSYRAHLNSC